MTLGPYIRYRIQALETEAREREGHANALEADAIAERQGAERCRKTTEYLRKSQTQIERSDALSAADGAKP